MQFSDPGAGFASACATCHHHEVVGNARPAFADVIPLSLVPLGPSTTNRNAPTLLDTNQMTWLYHDGRFTSLEDLIKDKLLGRHYGWSSKHAQRARDEIQSVLLNAVTVDKGRSVSYVDQFKEAYGVDLNTISNNQTTDLVVRSIAEYVRTLKTTRTAPWDAFAAMNRINPGPNEGETPYHYAGRVFGRLGNLEGRLQIKLVDGFDVLAYRGFKIFFRTNGEASVGHCVSCHVPPNFTDFRFHNTGISQVAYDELHGAGSFNLLDIPNAEETPRPRERFLSPPAKDDPQKVDLGHWNFVDLKMSPQRAEGQSAEEFLDRMMGAFKTPALRNLGQSSPYMHNGAYKSLEDAVNQIVRINELARAGKMRNIHPSYLAMNLTEKDIQPLVAFLKAINEVPPENFRDLMLSAQIHTGEIDSP
jgi:cytochrome c peroxidase